MKLVLFEFTEGKGKGFRFYAPQLESAELNFNSTEVKTNLEAEKLLGMLNLSIKQRVADGIQRDKGKFFGEGLAMLHPDGILNRTDNVTIPWRVK